MNYLVIPSREWLVAQTDTQRQVLVRRAQPQDTALVARLLLNLSPRSRELRYLLAAPITDEWLSREVRRITSASRDRAVTLLATVEVAGREEAVALAEIVRDPHAAGAAEVAICVRDDYQRLGIGSLLLREIVGIGRAWGLGLLRAETLVENEGAQRLVRSLALPLTVRQRNGARQILIALAGPGHALHSMFA